MNILCVLKSGGVYNKEYVLKLKRAVTRNVSHETPFICLTDTVDETMFDGEIIWEPLQYGWPGWWSKVEMWRPDLEEYGRMLYFDLDMVITGNLDDIASYEGDAAVTYDFGYNVPSQTLINYTPGALREIWDTFVNEPEYWMRAGDKMEAPFWGDQILTTKAYSGTFDHYQNMHPGQIVSLKKHCMNGLPENARVVSFHGNPKPHGVTYDWVGKHWI